MCELDPKLIKNVLSQQPVLIFKSGKVQDDEFEVFFKKYLMSQSIKLSIFVNQFLHWRGAKQDQGV